MKVAVDIDPVRLFQDETSKDKRFELTSDRILYEDPDLILVDKPAGLPAHPTVDESRDNLFAAVTRFLEKRDGKTPYLGIHQRLDRDTSGIVLFTKSRQVNPALAELFSAHKIIKTYQALTEPRVSGKRKEKWTVRNRLGKMSSRGKRTRYGAVDSGGDFAETAFRVIEEYPVGLWIEAMPKTGRTHQIRVHLAEDGMPILGDDLYGGGHSHDLASRLMLHAVELKFPHPLSGVQLSVKSALPIDFVRVLDRMRNSKGL
ncbi:MAG TPA: RluA family pseudouridine synthase [Terriglobia bacterium]|nr:RluA family pseudouridine synthase [Terriglobia bacterium]